MFKSLDRKKVRLFIDVLFACLSLLDQELSPFFYNGGRPLVSILNLAISTYTTRPLVNIYFTGLS